MCRMFISNVFFYFKCSYLHIELNDYEQSNQKKDKKNRIVWIGLIF